MKKVILAILAFAFCTMAADSLNLSTRTILRPAIQSYTDTVMPDTTIQFHVNANDRMKVKIYNDTTLVGIYIFKTKYPTWGVVKMQEFKRAIEE